MEESRILRLYSEDRSRTTQLDSIAAVKSNMNNEKRVNGDMK